MHKLRLTLEHILVKYEALRLFFFMCAVPRSNSGGVLLLSFCLEINRAGEGSAEAAGPIDMC